eukprot:snap_masked-scaffold_3-processed-gene-20.6-mRNA-1 protein AED:1.00 eAED:1.00 QI:0/0/0/0/1/1/3/0/343
MCLTWSGKSYPEQDLCGNHGECIQDICVCFDGWSNSLDLNHGYLGQHDYSDILQEVQNKSDIVTLESFYEQLLLSSPCNRYDPIMSLMFSFSILACLTSIVFSFCRKKLRTLRTVHSFRTVSLISYASYSCIKLVKGNQANEIFYFPAGLFLSISIVSINASVIFYLYKHLKYQLEKAKTLYRMQVSLFGYGIIKVLRVEAILAMLINFIIFVLVLLTAPVYVFQMRDHNLKSDNIINLFNLYHKCLLKSFMQDINSVLDSREMNEAKLSTANIVDQSSEWKNKLEIVLIRISSIRFSIRLQAALVGASFLILLLYPRFSNLIQYIAHFHAGCIYPIQAIKLY